VRANWCLDEAFRERDRAPVMMKLVFDDEGDWLCSVQLPDAILGPGTRTVAQIE
jgi:hypothetical protein